MWAAIAPHDRRNGTSRGDAFFLFIVIVVVVVVVVFAIYSPPEPR
jgi:t-SNARE complex subunit (syntaxin)